MIANLGFKATNTHTDYGLVLSRCVGMLDSTANSSLLSARELMLE